MNDLLIVFKFNLLILFIDILIFICIRFFQRNDNKLQVIKLLSTISSILIYFCLTAMNIFVFNLFIFITILLNGYIYFHIVNIMITSRRLKLLEYMNSNVNCSYEDIKLIYSSENMISKRIKRLKTSYQIYETNERLFIRNSILLLAAELLYFLSIIFNVRWNLIFSIKKYKKLNNSND